MPLRTIDNILNLMGLWRARGMSTISAENLTAEIELRVGASSAHRYIDFMLKYKFLSKDGDIFTILYERAEEFY